MKKSNKLLWILLCILGALFLLTPFILIFMTFTDFTNDIQDLKDKFGYTDSDVIAYVEEKHDIDVKIIQSASQSGKSIDDAIVQTLDDDELEFNVQVNFLGMISGDTYAEVKQRYMLSEKYQDSQIFKKLGEIGFQDMTFEKEFKNDEYDFYMNLPEVKELADIETFRLLYEAVPLLRDLKIEVSKKDYELNEVQVGSVNLDITTAYESPEDLGNKLASENIDAFTYPFIEDDYKKVLSLDSILNENNFKLYGNGQHFKCYDMQTYKKCNAYYILLDYKPDSNDSFIYDSKEDRDALLNVIKEIQSLDIPVEAINVSYVEIPTNLENQIHPREELEEMEEGIQFSNRAVWINEIQNIRTAKDIYFEDEIL